MCWAVSISQYKITDSRPFHFTKPRSKQNNKNTKQRESGIPRLGFIRYGIVTYSIVWYLLGWCTSYSTAATEFWSLPFIVRTYHYSRGDLSDCGRKDTFLCCCRCLKPLWRWRHPRCCRWRTRWRWHRYQQGKVRIRIDLVHLEDSRLLVPLKGERRRTKLSTPLRMSSIRFQQQTLLIWVLLLGELS